jgi:ribosomal protein S10
MTAKAITLRSDLVERLETLARTQGRTLDDVFADLLEQYSLTNPNWALTLAEAMEKESIDWQDEASGSAHSREHFERNTFERWQRAQDTAADEHD